MQKNANEYLSKTESAVKYLFEGINTYISPLRKAASVIFVSGKPPGEELDNDYRMWQSENVENLDNARKLKEKFRAEEFALSMLCGGVLQIADKAIELYSNNESIHTEFQGKLSFKLTYYKKFCVGRLVRGVPLGLIIMAGRNQHAHFEQKLRSPSSDIFRLISELHSSVDNSVHSDHSFNLEVDPKRSLATNITALVGWRSYKQYITDMQKMLNLEE